MSRLVRYRRRLPSRPPSHPNVGITTVRAIIKAVSTHWICITSARRLVIMVGTAMLIDPIITEWVRHPRMSDRLMAHRAEGATAVAAPVAVVGWGAILRGALAMGSSSLSGAEP